RRTGTRNRITPSPRRERRPTPGCNRGSRHRPPPPARRAPPAPLRLAGGSAGTGPRRRRRPARPGPDRTGAFLRVPPPGFVVVGVVEGRFVEAPLRLVDDAPALGDLGTVVGAAHLVVKQLAARVAEEFLELRRRVEQPAPPRAVQLLYPFGQRAQQRHQAQRPLRTIDFVAHRDLPGAAGTRDPRRGIIP